MITLANNECRIGKLVSRSGSTAFAVAYHDYPENLVVLVTPHHLDFKRVSRMYAKLEQTSVPPGFMLTEGEPA